MQVHIFSFKSASDTISFKKILDSSNLGYDLDFTHTEAHFTVKYHHQRDLVDIIRKFDRIQFWNEAAERCIEMDLRAASYEHAKLAYLLADRYFTKEYVKECIDELKNIQRLNEIDSQIRELGYQPSEFDHLQKSDFI